MLEFIREGRSRSEVALKREAGKERERIMEKLRNRPRHSENLIPQYLSNQQSTSSNRWAVAYGWSMMFSWALDIEVETFRKLINKWNIQLSKFRFSANILTVKF